MMINSDDLLDNINKYFSKPKELPQSMDVTIDEIRIRQGVVKVINYIEAYAKAKYEEAKKVSKSKQ
jgi:predicted nucleotidyltransferase